MEQLNMIIRPMLFKVLSWKAGKDHDFSVSVGKSGKYLERYLPKELYESYLRTYPAGEKEAIWKSVLEMCDLFEIVAREVSQALGCWNMSINFPRTQKKSADHIALQTSIHSLKLVYSSSWEQVSSIAELLLPAAGKTASNRFKD